MAEQSTGGSSSERQLDVPTVRDHLANERTLLAWLRTAITLVGLGFIIDRLALQAAGTFERLAGIVLVIVGALVALAGAYSYLRARRELVTGSYQPIVGLHLAVVALVIVGALVLAAYLVFERPAL